MIDCEALLRSAMSVERDIDVLRHWCQETAWPHPACPVICVAGTNGKGSVCMILESILRAAGYRVGVLTSPHLFSFEERIRIEAEPVSPEVLFSALQQLRLQVEEGVLHAFDYVYLSAMSLFTEASLDAVIIEVGLGGRSDPARLSDYDCLVMTNIDVDHEALLGETRELVAQEKLALLRSGVPCIYADTRPLALVDDQARTIGCPCIQLGRDFGYYVLDGVQWLFWDQESRVSYAYPALLGTHQLANVSAALMALSCLKKHYVCAQSDVRLALLTVRFPGRFQLYSYDRHVQIVYDVAHNVHAALMLNHNLSRLAFVRQQIAIMIFMRDKNISGMLKALYQRFDTFIVLETDHPRALPASDLMAHLLMLGVPQEKLILADSPEEAWEIMIRTAQEGDVRAVVCGSFLVVKIMASSSHHALAFKEN